MTRPGVNEAEIEAEFAHEFIRNRASFAYLPIIAAGKNSCVLHYNQNDQSCLAGDLVLLDVAAAYGNYMSDLTRTIPVSGRFTRRQKQVYNAVLRTFLRQIEKAMVPGKTIVDLRKETGVLLERECVDLGLLKPGQIKRQDPDTPAVRKYFMHGGPIRLAWMCMMSCVWERRSSRAGCSPANRPCTAGGRFWRAVGKHDSITPSGPEDLMADVPIEADEVEDLMKH